MLDSMFYRPQGLFDQLNTLHKALSRSLANDGAPDSIRSVAMGAYPGVNVGRTPNSLEVYAFAPGMDVASIEVTVERGVLKLAGERRAPSEAMDDKVQAYASERTQGRFSRAITLPDDVDTGKVEATYRDGLLQVSIAVAEAAQPQRIAVQ